jgi:uncharacterized membrane protein YhaH (DUF805 family)
MKNYLNGWKRIFNFRGKSTRSQFWTFTIINVFIYMIAYILISADVTINGEYAIFADTLLTIIYLASIPHFIASLSLSIRRLHDTGKSGWCLLLGLIPVQWMLLLTLPNS